MLAGPAVTVPIVGTQAIVILTAQIQGSTGQSAGFMSVAVSGATTIAASDANSLRVFGNDANRSSATVLITGLNPGSNTFTAVYKTVGSGSAVYGARNILVIPG